MAKLNRYTFEAFTAPGVLLKLRFESVGNFQTFRSFLLVLTPVVDIPAQNRFT
jgi:hypothetical protein